MLFELLLAAAIVELGSSSGFVYGNTGAKDVGQ